MSDEPEEEGFTFRDRRRSQSDAAPTPAAPAPSVVAPTPPPMEAPSAPRELLNARGELNLPAEPPAMGPSDDVEGDAGEFTLPDVRDLLTEYLLVLRDIAVLRLGLAPNPSTNLPEPDFGQAKIAIDTIAFLSSQIEPFLHPDERLPLKAMLSDLQLAYVRQTGG